MLSLVEIVLWGIQEKIPITRNLTWAFGLSKLKFIVELVNIFLQYAVDIYITYC